MAVNPIASAIAKTCGSVGTTTPHGDALTVLLSSVTAPFLARALPVTDAPVVNVMLVSARMFPTNDVVVPSVAELPTCQNTLHTEPPLIFGRSPGRRAKYPEAFKPTKPGDVH